MENLFGLTKSLDNNSVLIMYLKYKESLKRSSAEMFSIRINNY